MANTKIADIQADFTPFAELSGQTLGVADKRIRPGEMAQNEHAARCFSFFATEAFPTREILLGVWRLNVLATTSGPTL